MFAIIQFCLVLSLLVLIHVPTGYSMHTKCTFFYTKTIRYSFSLDNNYKFTANVREKDHKITKIHHFVA